MQLSICKMIAPALALTGLLAASAAANAANTPPPSTFQASCRHIAITGSTVTAECRRNNGSYKHTWLRVAGVENLHGVLHYTTVYESSTFQDSCKDIKIAGAAISALCLKDDGAFAKTWIAIPDLVNENGDLRYGRVPPGK
jgi:hypothetical protein